jgi:hypothetical protein
LIHTVLYEVGSSRMCSVEEVSTIKV